MKKIQAAVAECMTGLETSDKTITSHFVFPEEFVGFQGHFPGKKILPGVCEIQCALLTVEKAKQKTLDLKEVALAKYFVPVLPNEEIICVVSDAADSGEFMFKAIMAKGSTKVAELKLRVVIR